MGSYELVISEDDPMGHSETSLEGIIELEISVKLVITPVGAAVRSIGAVLVELQTVSVTVVIGPGG